MEDIRTDKDVLVISKEVEPIQKKVEDLIITTELQSKYATDLLAFITKARKRLEERRKFFVTPLNEGLKNINSEFRQLIQPLEDMEASIKEKMMSYMEAARAKARADAVVRQAEMDKVAKDNNLPTVEVAPEEVRQVKSGIGAVHTRKTWTWRITEEKKVPAEFWIIDEKKLNNMVRAFTRVIDGCSTNNLHIEGIEVYQEESIAVRT